MTYTWSEEQRRGLTFGSTVIARGFTYVVNYIWGDWVYIDGVGYPINEFDPSTLRPPSIEWIRELARERLGADAHVYDLETSIDIEWNCYMLEISLENVPGVDRFRAAVAAIVALANAGLGRKGGGDGCEG